MNEIIQELEVAIAKIADRLHKNFAELRGSGANRNMVEMIQVEAYGGDKQPLSQLANIGTPDALTIVIDPWDKSLVQAVESGLVAAGWNPKNDGQRVIINMPPLTEEIRREAVKQAKRMFEDACVSLRNARGDVKKKIDGMEVSDDEKATWMEKMEDVVKKAKTEKLEKMMKEKEVVIMRV